MNNTKSRNILLIAIGIIAVGIIGLLFILRPLKPFSVVYGPRPITDAHDSLDCINDSALLIETDCSHECKEK